MTQEEIKNLILIDNEDINNEIKNIKDFYNININNELLENLVKFSLKSIDYYNKKYNYFSGNDYEKLFLFADEFYNASRYKYNLLSSANYQNENYIDFLSLFENNQTLEKLSNIFNIIQMQIIMHEHKENFLFKIKKPIDKSKLSTKEIIDLDLPFNENTLLLTYFYLYQDEDNNKTFEIINEKIQDNLNLIKIGICYLFEDIYFNFTDYYEKTNMKSGFYLEILEQNNLDYNYQLHKTVLDIVKEMI